MLLHSRGHDKIKGGRVSKRCLVTRDDEEDDNGGSDEDEDEDLDLTDEAKRHSKVTACGETMRDSTGISATECSSNKNDKIAQDVSREEESFGCCFDNALAKAIDLAADVKVIRKLVMTYNRSKRGTVSNFSC